MILYVKGEFDMIHKRKILILDDDHRRMAAFYDRFEKETHGNDVYYVGTADEAIALLKKHEMDFDMICLDHDLSEEDNRTIRFGKGTGTEVASFMAGNFETKRDFLTYVILHSTNSVGVNSMFNILDSVGFYVVIRPMLWMHDVFHATMKLSTPDDDDEEN